MKRLSHSMAAIPPPYRRNTPDDSEAPPSYDTSESSSSHPLWSPSQGIDDELPAVVQINNNSGAPLVRPSELQAHLVLLGAFHRLREEVRTQKGIKVDIQMSPDNAWAVFLQRAVYRFDAWVEKIIGNVVGSMELQRVLAPQELPPLDVIMVWHTYLLNPRTYYEDCLRRLQGLHQVGSFPLVRLCSTIDAETLLPLRAPEEQKLKFLNSTGMPFDPPVFTTSEDLVQVACPNCGQTRDVPWITHDGRGFGQRNFEARCERDDFVITREKLSVHKFYADMKLCIDSKDEVLANTLVDHQKGLPTPDVARRLTSMCLKLDANPPAWTGDISGKQYGWKFKNAENILRRGFLSIKDSVWVETPRIVNIILSAYRGPTRFSIDLASAVMRQMGFIEKMVNFGWTEFERFDEDHDTLTRAVVRYHGFLDIMSAKPGATIVPTLDIDLAWHTHQLLCESYRKLQQIIGAIPDHDDKIAQGPLATAYDNTAEAWKERFGVPYSVCGCLPPSAKFGSGTDSVLARFKGKGKAKASTLNNLRPDLVSIEDMNAEETHPSDHNTIALLNPKAIHKDASQKRQQEVAKRAKDFTRKVEKGMGGDWGDLQARRAVGHNAPFLPTVEYGAKEPFGAFGNGECATYSGAAIVEATSAGACARGSGLNGLCLARADWERPNLKDYVRLGDGLANGKDAMGAYGPQTDLTMMGLVGLGPSCAGGACGGF